MGKEEEEQQQQEEEQEEEEEEPESEEDQEARAEAEAEARARARVKEAAARVKLSQMAKDAKAKKAAAAAVALAGGDATAAPAAAPPTATFGNSVAAAVAMEAAVAEAEATEAMEAAEDQVAEVEVAAAALPEEVAAAQAQSESEEAERQALLAESTARDMEEAEAKAEADAEAKAKARVRARSALANAKAVAMEAAGKRKASDNSPPLPFRAVKSRPAPPSSSAATLTDGKRGAVVAVKPAAMYGAGKSYFWKDVVAVAKLLQEGKIALADLDKTKPDGSLLHKVPRTSMTKWLADDAVVMQKAGKRGIAGTAHWRVEIEVRNRVELSKAGASNVLGAAETRLRYDFGDAARKGKPYLEEEIESVLLTTLVSLELDNPMTKQRYTYTSEISVLLKGFLQRCNEAGVPLLFKAGRKLGLQRHLRSSWETLDKYCKQVASPALLAFQRLHNVKLTLTDVGNMDEAQVDLCDFAQHGNFLVLDCFGSNVVVPYEQSPHFTLKWGFIGRELMLCAMIKIGNGDAAAPHPHHCQLLKSDRNLVLMQSTNGWTNAGLANAFFDLQYEHPDVPLGPTKDGPAQPKVINMDGHSAHIYNEPLKQGFDTHKILALSPPAHTTAPRISGSDPPKPASSHEPDSLPLSMHDAWAVGHRRTTRQWPHVTRRWGVAVSSISSPLSVSCVCQCPLWSRQRSLGPNLPAWRTRASGDGQGLWVRQAVAAWSRGRPPV